MADSIEKKIQDALKVIIEDIGLAGVDDSNIKILELPKINEVLDALPCVLICSRRKTTEAIGFEGRVERVYVEEILFIDGREGDEVTEQDKVQRWHEQGIEAVEREQSPVETSQYHQFRTTLPGVPTVYSVEVGDVETIDRTKLSDNYAVLGFFVTVKSTD